MVLMDLVPFGQLCVDLGVVGTPVFDVIVHSVNALKRRRHLLFRDVRPLPVLLHQEGVQELHLKLLFAAFFSSKVLACQVPDVSHFDVLLVVFRRWNVEVRSYPSSHI